MRNSANYKPQKSKANAKSSNSEKKNTVGKAISKVLKKPKPDTGIRLNRYIANSGICSRREADLYIKTGSVWVNGKPVTEMGYKVALTDEVKFDGRLISPEKKEYFILNKPKDFLTTTSPSRQRTVMQLLANASQTKIVPVGRLERNTTGLLLFTNDTDLEKKLNHHQTKVTKLYHVHLDRNFKAADFEKMQAGIKLEVGFVKVDQVAYVSGASKKEIGIQIQSSKNGIIRKLCNHLRYDVIKLDRVVYAGLTKKNLPRGHWRKLTKLEVINLKML